MLYLRPCYHWSSHTPQVCTSNFQISLTLLPTFSTRYTSPCSSECSIHGCPLQIPSFRLFLLLDFVKLVCKKVLNDNWEILIEMPSFSWNAFQTDKQCFSAVQVQSKSSSMRTPKPMGQRTECSQYCWQIYWYCQGVHCKILINENHSMG